MAMEPGAVHAEAVFFSLHISRISYQITFIHSRKTLRTGKQWNKSSLADIQVTRKSTFI